jgi:hypothetical protein
MDCIKYRFTGYEGPIIIEPLGIVLDEAWREVETADLGGAWFIYHDLGTY